ncbi:C-type lectin domain family 2 member B-like, partial [Bombina bombina]|uniref:C-type lectin domain family 2 member B-like n=1 Tax=Bombina bombina TaxID=8345 RepID=UPI00235A5E0F
EKEQRSNGSNRNAQGKELLYDKGPYALCPMNWILIRKKCYFFSENKKNQSDSKKNCTDSGARLATTSATESNLQRFIRMTSQDYWVGLENLGTHHQGGDWTGKWSDGRTDIHVISIHFHHLDSSLQLK